ncbi:hypothetical protein, partial [uncultured Methylobacterium sp.]|uniref:hypothetical protein n=1 Tax=uncultured Methylobacterium sp. TaxID=157278 RepID=UPI0035CBCF9E
RLEAIEQAVEVGHSRALANSIDLDNRLRAGMHMGTEIRSSATTFFAGSGQRDDCARLRNPTV